MSTHPTTHASAPSTPYELEQLTVRGSFYEMGQQYGAHFKEKIQAFAQMRLDSAAAYFAEWGRGSVEELKAKGAACWELAQGFHPEGAQEHMGIAAGAGLEPALLYAVTNMTDVRDVVLLPDVPPPDEDEGCTSALASGALCAPPFTQGLYGQTWDLNPPDIDFIAAIHRLPDEGPETWTVTCVGCLTLVGMNQYGLSVGTTNLKTWRSQVGVGYLSVLHKALSQSSHAQAAEVFASAPVAGAHSYWLGSELGGFEWERSPHYSFARACESSTPPRALGRSNHCLFEPHQQIEGVKVTPSSAARVQRADELLNAAPVSLEALKAIFADRADGIHSINRYPEDLQGTTTNAVAISDPAARVFHACRGSADRGLWYELGFERA
jgi:isopenicillin-N N-acyltransferase like protein